jgi:agmatinase
MNSRIYKSGINDGFSRGDKNLKANHIAVLGIPLDWNSSFRRGAALAPKHIREALFSPSAHMWTERGIDLGTIPDWHILDDLVFPDRDNAFHTIENAIAKLLKRKISTITLGGDHSITYPIICAYSASYPDLNILQLDAHPDLYDELYGNRQSHGCPFARIMEENLIKRLVQVGIRSMTNHHREQAQRFGVEIVHMSENTWTDKLSFDGPVYLSLDLDCLDPAFAPGVSHHEPGGMSTREVIRIIQNLQGNLVGADIVELNPQRDSQDITAMVAAKLLREILGRMLEKKS